VSSFDTITWQALTALALLSLVLFTVAGALARRRDRRAGRSGSTPVAPSTPTAGQVEAGPVRSGADDDLADVEEILRRRGIT
jgi:hypothetical protein